MDLATVDHVLTTTRSVRKRLDLTRPVEQEIIQDCLEIALSAAPPLAAHAAAPAAPAAGFQSCERPEAARKNSV